MTRAGSIAATVPSSMTQGRKGGGTAHGPSEPTHPLPALSPAKSALTPEQLVVARDRVAALAAAKKSGVAQEVVSARTADTAEFVNPNGTSTTRFYQGTQFVPSPHSPALQQLNTLLTLRWAD